MLFILYFILEKFRVASVSSNGGSKDYLYNEDLVSPSSAVSSM